MNGKIAVSAIIGVALIAGAAIYWLQLYAFYDELDPATTEIRLTSMQSGQGEVISVNDFSGIDAGSSPLRFRGCFTVPTSLSSLTETYVAYADPVPLTGPGWFDCYDAVEIGTALERGDALAFLGEENIRDGVDRVVAVYSDGRAFVWHQLNDKFKE